MDTNGFSEHVDMEGQNVQNPFHGHPLPKAQMTETFGYDTYEDPPPVHDQLPSLEEYKAKLGSVGVIDPMMEKSQSSAPRSSRVLAGDFSGEEEEVFHDQLPSVEEIKIQNVIGDGGKSSYRRALHRCLFLVSLLVVVVVPPAVVFTLRNQGASSSVTSLRNRDERLRLVQDYLIRKSVADETDVMTVGTPQYLASNWIARQDEMQIAIPNDNDPMDNPFIQRYALVVIYFATGGPAWNYQLDFLSPKDACEWFTEFRIEGSDEIVKLGVSGCTRIERSDKVVRQLWLRK